MLVPSSPPRFPIPPAGTGRDDPGHVRVMLVDDHPAVRVGVRELIDQQPDLRVVAEAATPEAAVEQFDHPIDVAIVDYDLGEAKDGLWLTAELKLAEAPPQVLVYSAFADGGLTVLALLAGADGLLGKHELPQVLCRVIRTLARGGHHLPAVTPAVAHAMRSRLHPRDQAIFGMVLHGMAPSEVAARLQSRPTPCICGARPCWPRCAHPPVGLPYRSAHAPRSTTSVRCDGPAGGRPELCI